MKRLIAMLLALSVILILCACGGDPTSSSESSSEGNAEPENIESYDARSFADDWVYNEVLYVGLGEARYVDIPYYALENVTYCTNPVDDVFQTFNIYVPACYMTQNEDGTVVPNENGIFGVMGEDGSTLMYMTEEAPIVYVNTISGYAAGLAPKVGDGRMGDDSGYYYQFLEQGCILVTVSARGSSSTDADGNVNGTVPAALVDLKSGVRWLTYNDAYLPGDSDKIVSIGVSSGGGISTLLGASGNSALFDPYLGEIGALDSSDSIWATVAYCPITDLPFADGAYWWQAGVKKDDSFDAALTQALFDEYVAYVQSLGFDLGDDGRSGEFYEGYEQAFEDSFNNYIARTYSKSEDAAKFIAEIDPTGTWLTYDATHGAQLSSLQDYIANYWGNRPADKGAAVYDSFDRASMEGDVLGNKHFSWIMLNALESVTKQYPEMAGFVDEYKAEIEGGMSEIAALYNPLTFIGGEADVSPNWRFRIGGEDTDAAHALAWIVYNALLKSEDVNASYEICYGIGHCTVEYDPYDVITWIYVTDLGVAPVLTNKKAIQMSENVVIGGDDAPVVEDVTGTYYLDEINSAGLAVSWTLELKEDYTYALSETGVVDLTYTGEYAVVNGYVSLGPINEETGPHGQGFGQFYESVWTVDKVNGTCQYVDLSLYTDPSTVDRTAPVGGGAAQPQPTSVVGTYYLDEINSAGLAISWTLELLEDKTYALSETGVVDLTYTGDYVVANGYVSLGPINEETGPHGQAFGQFYESVWEVDPLNKTCQYVDLVFYVAP